MSDARLALVPASDPNWRKRANCRGTDPEEFYPDKGGTSRQAKRICSRCPVQTECLEWAVDNDERFGIWGGKTENERKQIRRQRRAGQTLEMAA